LLHLDIKKLGRFDRPGHRASGRRTGCRNRGAGGDFVHVAVDDAIPAGLCRIPARRAQGHNRGLSAARPALVSQPRHRGRTRHDRQWLSLPVAPVPQGKALRWLAIRNIHTRPCTPKPGGKAERFIQTLLRDWADGLAHPSSNARNADLPRWLDWFNRSRPHSALKALSPFLAVNKLMRNHS
jgi:transposase InsO family protein